jgi:hypothetical protein
MVNSDHPGRQVAYHGIASINHGVELNSLLLNAPSLGVDYQSLAIAYQQKHHENDEYKRLRWLGAMESGFGWDSLTADDIANLERRDGFQQSDEYVMSDGAINKKPSVIRLLMGFCWR